ncbi:hypothetical protein [Oceanobacillus oncorhynchi]|uniref:Uncharacterized protein n=1 Tax=Oceanobacillus oncorhynchi TaxID=545501 RepID=A0A0A1MBV2_9BACI|nr:hypothetical protein [Oceanobacillus oncorhynchi]MDM8100779.1 hypothetical protein [Oceanobacillus oncorhynchi]UUI41365.1 hypothetical protein NP440_07430 [Oceanobacillus oncorhynchi]CEI82790.1 hypothetical protein BN997_02676 [Oceanobacillus oncorhynchi]
MQQKYKSTYAAGVGGFIFLLLISSLLFTVPLILEKKADYMKHDRLKKKLIQEFFEEFIEAFFPNLHPHIDFSKVTFPAV